MDPDLEEAKIAIDLSSFDKQDKNFLFKPSYESRHPSFSRPQNIFKNSFDILVRFMHAAIK